MTTTFSTTTLSPAFSVLPTLRDLHVGPCIFAGGACVGFCWAVAGGHQEVNTTVCFISNTSGTQTKQKLSAIVFFFEALSQILKSENNSRLCTCSLIAAIPLCWIPDTSKWNLGKVRSRCKQLLQLKDFKDGKTPTGMPHKVLIDSISHTIHV